MKKGLTKQEVIDWAISKGYHKDKYGHLQKGEHRIKIQATSIRYEVKVHHPAALYSGAKNEWMRLRSGYLKDLSIKEGKLSGLK